MQEIVPSSGPSSADRVEVPALRTLDSQTFLNPDGSYTTEYSTDPIFYDPGDGNLRPIDLTPVASAVNGAAYETKAAPVISHLGDSSAGDVLTVASRGHSVAFRPVQPPQRDGTAPAASRSPSLADGQVLYRNVYPSVDLRYTLLPTGAKEDIVLTAPTAVNRFAFLIDAPGLSPQLNDDGSVDLLGKEGKIFHIPTPFMVDSAPEPDGDGARSLGVSYQLVSTGTDMLLVISADAKWLADPERVYPVYIDPTTTDDNVANLDTFISSGYPSYNLNAQWNPNEGGYYELWNGRYDSVSGTNYAYVKTAIPSAASVTSATFHIYVQHSYMGGTATGIQLGKLTSAFTESQTWNMTQPTYSFITSDSVADNQWADFSVTSTVQSWVEGASTNYGFRIYESSTDQSLWKRLRARENGGNISTNKPPYLSVTYTNPVATVVSPSGATWTNTSLLDWTFSANGSSFSQTKYQAQVSTSSSTWSGGSLKADSGVVTSSATSWTAPTTNLVTGTTYYWRVKVYDGHSWSAWTSAASFKWDTASASFTSVTVGGAISAEDPNFYDLGNGTFTVKIRGSDANSGIKRTYLQLYNATDALAVYHDWVTGGTNCTVSDTSTLANATACSETYNSSGTREVQFTVAGLGSSTSFDVRYYFTDIAGNRQPTSGWTDTGKNLLFDATAPTGSISAPSAGATVSGSVAIKGTASDANFLQYDVYYGAGASPSSWTGIGTNPRSSPVTNGTLATWNTVGLSMGTYTIRVRVYDKARVSSGYTTVTRTVTIDNDLPTAIIDSPTGDRLEDGVLTISGTASAASLWQSYTLEYGAGCSPASWNDIGTNPYASQVTDGTLGSWDTAGLTGQYTVRLVARRTDGALATATVCVRVGSSLGLQAQHSFETWDLGGGDQLGVNVATGDAVVSHPLVSLPYRGGSLALDLTYNSLATDNVGLGAGWQLSLQRRLILNPNGTVTFVDADGARHLFTNPVTNGTVTTYTRPAATYAVLVKDTSQADEFTLTYRDLTADTFDIVGSVGLLMRSEDRYGNGIDFAYSSDNLSTATDPAGRQVTFTWDTNPTPDRLTAVSDWAYVDGNGVVQTSASGSHRSYRFFYDGSGQLIGWSDPLNTTGSCPTGGSHLTCLAYTAGLLTSIGKTQTVTTLSAGSLGTTTRSISTELTYADGRVASVTDAEQIAQAQPAPTSFTWETASSVLVERPTTITGYELLAADDAFARVQSVLRYLDPQTPIERRTTWDGAYPVEPASVTDNFGAALSTPAHTVTYTYQSNSLGLLSKLVEPLTATTNRWTEYTYNANNDITEVKVNQDGSSSLRTITRYCYSSAAACPSADGLTLLAVIEDYVDGVGGTGAGLDDNDTDVRTEYGYDGYGQRTSVTRHNRDAAGSVLDDREDHSTFDANGNLTVQIVNYDDGSVTSPGDDITPNASTLARTDLTTAFAYDTAGNRVSSADPRRAVEAAKGTSLTNDDFVSRWTFDALNRQLTETTPATPGLASTQGTASSAYDELGLVRTSSDFGSLVAATEYDRAGRAIRTFQQPSGESAREVSRATFDADGRMLTGEDERQIADAALGQTTFSYDALGHFSAVTHAGGTADEATDSSTYDALDRQTSLEVGSGSASSQLTYYSHDLGGRVTETDDGFACTTETFDYRDLATVTISGLEGGTCASASETRELTHTYDRLGRLILNEVTAGADDGDHTLDDKYDSVGNRVVAGVLVDSVVSTSEFVINLLDQVAIEGRQDGSTAKTTFDAAGNPVDRCYWAPSATVSDCEPASSYPWANPPTQVTSASYDARNQRISLDDPVAGSVTTYAPDDNYAIGAVYRATGGGHEHQALYTYDERHRLTGIVFQNCTADGSHACTDTPVATGSDTYAYDDADNRTQVAVDNGAASSDYRYCYDARNQLVYRNTSNDCSSEAYDEAWVYDEAGNRLSAQSGASTTNFAYDTAGLLCDVEDSSAASCVGGNVSSDSAGRVSSWDGWSFAYDADGRLVSACKSPTCASGYDKVEFKYDGEGHRTQIVATASDSNVTTTDFRYYGDAVVEEKVDGVVVRGFVTDESGSISKLVIPSGQTDAGTYLVTWNGHGDAISLLRVNGDGTTTLANAFSYDTWGTPATSTHNGYGDLGFRYLYTGQFGVQWDDTLGLNLLYMHARHYSPALGRFLQPEAPSGDRSPFGYARNSPISRVDPLGTASWQQNTIEKWLCSLDWLRCLSWGRDSGYAILATSSIKDIWDRNAMRHCVWQCLLAYHQGVTWASIWGGAHEYASTNPLDTMIDLYNNKVGRALGDQLRRTWWLFGSTEAWASYLCTEAFRRGLLKTIRNNRVVYSNGRPA